MATWQICLKRTCNERIMSRKGKLNDWNKFLKSEKEKERRKSESAKSFTSNISI